MIATGGLLRMNRRQDSLRSKNRAENKRKRKSKKKRRNDVVVVKGKLNLCSPAGLVAAVGIVVLMVGISMAVLGYWPSQNQNEYQERRRTGAYNRMSYSKSPPVPANLTRDKTHAGHTKSPPVPANLTRDKTHAGHTKSPPVPANLTRDKTHAGHANVFNQSLSNSSGPQPARHCGFLCGFLDKHLYSDNLKVFGPLVMGIGIFLFICANAVLHENRDKKTKIINLRDIYSTVIDLHHIRSKEHAPLNGLVNYTQARNAEVPSPLAFPASGSLTRSSWPSTGLSFQSESGTDEVFRRPSLASRPRSWSRDVQTFTDTVYSIYKDYSSSSSERAAPPPRPWETTSIVTSSVNAFTLPVIKLNNCEVDGSQRAAAEGRSAAAEGAAIEAGTIREDGQAGGGQSDAADTKEKEESPPPLLQSHEEITTADQQEAPQAQPQPQPQGPQLLGPTGSRLSLNSLTELPGRPARRCSLSVSVTRPGDRGRRFSYPRLERSNSKGYIKLSDLGGESFEAPDTDTSLVADQQEVAADAAAAAGSAAAAAEEAAQGEEELVTPGTSAES